MKGNEILAFDKYRQNKIMMKIEPIATKKNPQEFKSKLFLCYLIIRGLCLLTIPPYFQSQFSSQELV